MVKDANGNLVPLNQSNPYPQIPTVTYTQADLEADALAQAKASPEYQPYQIGSYALKFMQMLNPSGAQGGFRTRKLGRGVLSRAVPGAADDSCRDRSPNGVEFVDDVTVVNGRCMPRKLSWRRVVLPRCRRCAGTQGNVPGLFSHETGERLLQEHDRTTRHETCYQPRTQGRQGAAGLGDHHEDHTRRKNRNCEDHGDHECPSPKRRGNLQLGAASPSRNATLSQPRSLRLRTEPQTGAAASTERKSEMWNVVTGGYETTTLREPRRGSKLPRSTRSVTMPSATAAISAFAMSPSRSPTTIVVQVSYRVLAWFRWGAAGGIVVTPSDYRR